MWLAHPAYHRCVYFCHTLFSRNSGECYAAKFPWILYFAVYTTHENIYTRDETYSLDVCLGVLRKMAWQRLTCAIPVSEALTYTRVCGVQKRISCASRG